MIELTQEQKITDIAERMERVREGIESLIQKYQVSPEAELSYGTKGIMVGVVLKDHKYKDENLDSRAQTMLYERFRSTKDAEKL